MTLNELNLIYFDARKKLQDELSARHEDDISTEPHLAGIRAVVEALRDEMTLGWEDDRPWGDVADVKKFLNKILASDGEEAAGSASAHTEGGVHEFRTGIGGTEGGQEGGPRGMEREGNVAGASGPGREQQDDLAVHLHRVPSGASSVSAGQQGSVVGITDGRAGGRLGRGHGVSRDEAAGGSTREDGRPSSGVLVRSNTADGLKAPAADLLIIDEAGKFTEEQWQYLHSSAATAEDLAIFGMAVSRVDGNGNVTRINSAEMFKDPNVCEWTRIDEDVLESGCDPDGWTYNPEIKRDTCPQCGKPIKFTEAK